MSQPILIEDIAECVTSRWRLTGLSRIVSGGLHYGRVPAEATSPYASLKIEAGEQQRFSKGRYIQPFTVTISLWSEDGLGDARLMRSEITNAFADRARLAIRVGKILTLKFQGDESEQDESLRDAHDVCISRVVFRLTCEGTR